MGINVMEKHPCIWGKKEKTKRLKGIFKYQDPKSLEMHLQYLGPNTEHSSKKFNQLLNPAPIIKLPI